MLGRLFCLGGRDPEWAAHAQYGAHTSSARARVLELVAEELEERFAALGPAAAGGRSTSHSQDAPGLHRCLYNVNLPSTELSQCRDLLRKLAAIDAARVEAEAEQQQLAAQLKSAEAAHRQAEFARARAEAIATARGEALMHAQQATREAEQENLQLGEMLRHCLDRLGLDADLTPLKPSPVPALLPGISEQTSAPVRHSIFSKQQLAVVAASISKLPPLHSHNHGQLQQHHWSAAEAQAVHAGEQELRRQEEELQHLKRLQKEEQQAQRYRASQEQERLAREQAEEEAELRRRQSRRSSRAGSLQSSQERGSLQQEHVEEKGAPRGSLDADQLSGFTVYTNELEADGEGPDAGEVVRPEAGQRSRRTSATGPERDSQGSGVQWRSISSAALSSRSGTSVHEHDQAAASELDELHAQHQGQQQRARQSHGSHGSCQQLRGSQEQAGLAGVPEQQQQAGSKLRRHARQLSRLVLPGLDASQLDSLVRIGASMQSPDQHLQGPQGQGQRQSPVEIVQQLLPPGLEQAVAQLDSSVNPLQSNTNAQAFLTELHAEFLRQSCDGGLERRAGAHVGNDPLGYDFYLDSKYPGAGTWVSPSLAAMIAHKKGYNPILDGGEPSPPSHIKAVFGTTEDREFYGPMAAHLNRREQPGDAQQLPPPPPLQQPAAPPRMPASRSAESVQGPQRQPPSNRSSFDGSRRSTDLDYQQQVAAAAARQAAAAPPQPPAGSHHGSLDQPPQQRRQAALRSGFQPMGMHAQASLALSVQQQQQQPRLSSIAVSQLHGSASAGMLADENLGTAAPGSSKELLRGAGLPPRGQQQQQVPATKRSLDSMRASLNGTGRTAQNIQASLNAVDAAMAALRSNNPHLSREQQQRAALPPPPAPQQPQRGVALAPASQAHQQQQQQAQPQPYGRISGGAGIAGGAGAGRGGVPRPGVHHTRTRSLPEVAALDLPLAAMGEEQRRKDGLQQPAAAGGRRAQRY